MRQRIVTLFRVLGPIRALLLLFAAGWLIYWTCRLPIPVLAFVGPLVGGSLLWPVLAQRWIFAHSRGLLRAVRAACFAVMGALLLHSTGVAPLGLALSLLVLLLAANVISVQFWYASTPAGIVISEGERLGMFSIAEMIASLEAPAEHDGVVRTDHERVGPA